MENIIVLGVTAGLGCIWLAGLCVIYVWLSRINGKLGKVCDRLESFCKKLTGLCKKLEGINKTLERMDVYIRANTSTAHEGYPRVDPFKKD